ncbi:lipase [Pseudoalteromonas sp. Scap03]|uniref:VolA/Pla-1 family phospholipase n=1 Tax=unclassified Pseudoalteromonas TaxID=194690 RepID=UPI0015C0B336|nr:MULTISPECIES: VolA/Pla-1 family phospholipase [unclassified Pseudoalteromonas]NWL16152.1 lipase [Pseudoalteromonas sp. Scap03]QLE81280.1 lipase [Pseudoalteromonas sp. Scap25]QLE89224.1 lipase [Pseudoalteromonas sp. Scap06]
MKKMLLSLSVAAALAGCGGGETLEDVKKNSVTVIPKATVKFDPANGVISVPNDLLMSGTLDGTINIPGELNSENVSIPRTAYADPQLAIGALDGWSTQVPFKIDLTFPPGISLDETSAASPGSVRIFEVIMGASLTDAECSQAPAGAACKLVGELTFGVDFVTQASGDAVAIVPLKPFKAGSSYINVLTTGLKDSEGRSIEPSSTYATVKQEAPLVTPSQLALQGAVNSYENVVVSSGDITKDDIIFSAAMTMQSAGPVLGTIKKVLAASLTEPTIPTPALQIPTQPMANVQQAFALQGVTVPDIFQVAQYQKGSIQLPMYLGTPTGKEISDLNDTYWQGMCDSAVAILGYKAQAGEAFPTDPISTNDAMCAALSDGQLRDLGLDSTKHLTKYNSLPKMQSMANVPVQITKPILPVVNAYRSGLGLEPFTAMPAGGWPVVIMQHGITTQKESMLTLTAQLSLQGFATVAIDHPRHGERGVDVDVDGNDDFNATTGSVLSYMNLSSLLVARDSLRQSSADLLGLRLGLNFSGDSSLNSTDVSYIGHSLGSIVAPAFIAQTNSPLAEQVDPLFKVNAVALASGGGGIASFLLESAAFGPFIQGSVLSQAGTAEADEFNAFLNADALSNCGALLPDMQDFLSCGFNEFAASLTMAGETDKLANIKGVMTQFVFAAQTALDSGDPTNYAATVKALETPVYMNVVVGDGTENNKPDQVIPPMTASNPIAGTVPLANFMGLETVSTTQAPTEMGSSYLVKFNTGHHGSVLTPAQDERQSTTVAGSAAANAEMQLQIATYLVSRGRLLSVSDTDIVTN